VCSSAGVILAIVIINRAITKSGDGLRYCKKRSMNWDSIKTVCGCGGSAQAKARNLQKRFANSPPCSKKNDLAWHRALSWEWRLEIDEGKDARATAPRACLS
jgi:hypothetical protein